MPSLYQVLGLDPFSKEEVRDVWYVHSNSIGPHEQRFDSDGLRLGLYPLYIFQLSYLFRNECYWNWKKILIRLNLYLFWKKST